MTLPDSVTYVNPTVEWDIVPKACASCLYWAEHAEIKDKWGVCRKLYLEMPSGMGYLVTTEQLSVGYTIRTHATFCCKYYEERE